MESGKVHIVDVFESDIKYSIQCFADGNAGAEKADWMSDWEHPTVPSITGDGRYIVGNAHSMGVQSLSTRARWSQWSPTYGDLYCGRA